MIRTLFHIIPTSFRCKCIGAVLSIFARALLNFIGLAVFIPVLVLVVDREAILHNTYLLGCYTALGFTSTTRFTLFVCGVILGVIVVKNLLNLLLYRVERNFIYDLYRTLSHRLYVDYHHRGLSFIKNSNSAVLARNINVVCLGFVSGVLMPLATIVSETMLFFLLFGAMLIYNATAAWITLLLFAPAVGLYYYLVRKRLSRYGEEENALQRKKSRTVIETFRGYADLEIANAYPALLQQFDRLMHDIIRMRKRNATIALLPSMFTELGLSVGLVVLILFYIGTERVEVKLMFGIFAIAALRLMPSVRGILSAWTSLRYNRYTIDVLQDAVAVAADAEPVVTTERLSFNHEIKVDNVGFHFADAPQREILKELSLTIRRGEHIGIRGASGVGKTTLFNLLLGFYTPTSGEIRIDGTPLDATTRRRWQNAIGYVSQSVFITDSSFATNVALGVPAEEIDRQRVEDALERAKLKEFIDTLPRGIDTPIGECGCRLSGGQRQRIGIARALYKHADILFFDEATSSLDNHTEERINRAIEELSNTHRDLTIIVIAHRESSLDYCDRVITLQ
jgi:ABC-type multidrug transport system fused ATPase/permease subunit